MRPFFSRLFAAAVETGILADFPKTVAPEDATQIPRENLMLLATGSQGETLDAADEAPDATEPPAADREASEP